MRTLPDDLTETIPPVAASKTTSLPEVGGSAVQYFHPLRVDEIAQVLNEILSNPSLQEEMKKEGIIQARKFSWNTMAAETLSLYEEILQKKGLLSEKSQEN